MGVFGLILLVCSSEVSLSWFVGCDACLYGLGLRCCCVDLVADFDLMHFGAFRGVCVFVLLILFWISLYG